MPTAGFSGAAVTRVQTSAGEFALRRWPAVPPPRARLEGLHALLAHVRRVAPDLPIAVPVATLGGETLFPLGNRLAQLEPWLPGEPLPATPTSSQLAAAGVALARFHSAAATFDPSPAARPYFAPTPVGTPRSLLDRRQLLAQWLDGGGERAAVCLRSEPPSPFRAHGECLLATLAAVGPTLAARLDAAAGRPVPLAPVLRDVHREHLLVAGDRVTGLIDPAAALADSPAADLARVASSFAVPSLAPLIVAYRTVRPLSEAEEALAGVLHDAGALLSGLAWVARGTWEEHPEARRPAALDRLAHFAAVAARIEPTPGVLV
ncbi:phosphotransferase [Alienimonas californiensis]|uniref:Homoserine kinase n=1 Tax=Alienimonas californiensis TaxID=2527989 RepID=A0A517PFI7_9PLAN|nr:phosphotransferase [Alienimonas californiensis]QDT18114.1 homoserine kinase [Alienimonas californiensis]